jgi:hypothetical protein
VEGGTPFEEHRAAALRSELASRSAQRLFRAARNAELGSAQLRLRLPGSDAPHVRATLVVPTR